MLATDCEPSRWLFMVNASNIHGVELFLASPQTPYSVSLIPRPKAPIRAENSLFLLFASDVVSLFFSASVSLATSICEARAGHHKNP